MLKELQQVMNTIQYVMCHTKKREWVQIRITLSNFKLIEANWLLDET
jgi:hypothetical protein